MKASSRSVSFFFVLSVVGVMAPACNKFAPGIKVDAGGGTDVASGTGGAGGQQTGQGTGGATTGQGGQAGLDGGVAGQSAFDSGGAGQSGDATSGGDQACTSGAKQCNGLQPQMCDTSGTWKDVGAACPNACSGGACSGACAPSSLRCNGLQPQLCGMDGLWQNMGNACVNVCAAGSCSGVCTPGSMQCMSFQPQKCDTTGQWQNAGAVCPSVCNGGSCAACAGGTKQCNGLQPQTCDPGGAWQNTDAACPNVCVAAACVGACKPSSVRCSNLQPQMCDVNGAWQSAGTACPYACSGGSCTGVCKSGETKCNGAQPQTCDPSANWQNAGAACSGCSVCANATGACTPATNGTVCSDSNSCSVGDTCQNGACIPGTSMTCAAPVCKVAGTCNPASGTCTAPTNAANSTSCDDGNPCTQTSSCQGGMCTGANPVTCPVPADCHVAGTCDVSSGMCTTPKAPDNTPCGGGLGRCLSGACDVPRFTRLPGMYPYAVSGDGGKVVGVSTAIPAFMWTRATGMVALPNALDSTYCNVSNISADGLYSIGLCLVGTAGTNVPERWSGMNVPVNLGIPSGFTNAAPNAVNANGSIMIGSAERPESHAVLWTVGANPTVLVEPAGIQVSVGLGISASGAVAVGYVRETAGQNIDHGFRWTAAGGMQLLPFLPGGTSAQANGVSADGNMIVGGCQLPSGLRPFLYVASSGMLTNLGIPNISDTNSSAQAISDDGTTIIGSAFPSGPWIWNGGSLQPLATKLANAGIDVGAFTLTNVVDLSSNGKVLVGTGRATGTTFDDGGWIAILP